jgi:hypothetical protein
MSQQEVPGTLSGAGAIDPQRKTTYFTSTGSAQALTMVDGQFYGQRVKVVHIKDGGSGVLANKSDGTGAKLTASLGSVTLTNVFESVELEWDGSVWNPIDCCPVAIAVAS